MSTARITTGFTNRLIDETSPYLLQHAHNPVDWYAWGPDAFAAARAQNKPIFLSVGYSTCYWCHVMERESFESETIAREMNQRFINIKVDREERPDVDQLYMTAVQILTRHGGWPMSVFLLPDLRPFYGGTYFPPTDAPGRAGFLTVLRAIDDAFHNRKDDVEQSAAELTRMLSYLAIPARPAGEIRIDGAFIDGLIDRSTLDFDAINGGFGGAPKFPRETLLELLLQSQFGNRKPALSAVEGSQITRTLDAMAAGGIRDQLGGAFHRYSTDAKWLVPHFEIMLYDNAMLASIYADAATRFGEARYADVARGIVDFVLREMTSPDGPFFTALDAEVDAHEGDPYLWTAAQVAEVLGHDDAKLFNHVYGLDGGFNFADPHGKSRQPDRNVLYLAEDSTDPRLPALRQKLYKARRQRKQPLLDTKIITSWNALMIRACVKTGNLKAANRAANFLWKHHRQPDGSLYRTSRDGKAKTAGFLDDYAFFAQALLALDRKDDAKQVVDVMVEKFAAPDGGFYFTAKSADDLIVRQMVGSDSPLPSGNAVAARVLMQLGRIDEARNTIAAFAPQFESNAESMSAMLQAAREFVHANGTIDVSAKPRAAEDAIGGIPSISQSSRDVVSLSSQWVDPTILLVRADIAAGFHLNAHDAKSPLIATRITLDAADAQVEYPPGQLENSATFTISFPAPPSADIQIKLSYQPCDAKSCLAPTSQSLTVNREP